MQFMALAKAQADSKGLLKVASLSPVTIQKNKPEEQARRTSQKNKPEEQERYFGNHDA